MRQKSTGTLVIDALTPAKRLFMISTGTGIAPFASLIRDPDTYREVRGDHRSPTPAATMPNSPMASSWSTNLAADPLIGELTAGPRHALFDDDARDHAAHGPHHRG